MEEKTNQLLAQAKKIMGNDADVMIVVHKNVQFSSTLSGNHENIAMAIFTAMHTVSSNVCEALFRILLLNVTNIVRNKSMYMERLFTAINNVVCDHEDEGGAKNDKGKVVQLYAPKNDNES